MRFSSLTHFVLGVLFLAGCATVPPRVSIHDVPLQTLCHRHTVTCKLDEVSHVITLKYNSHKARALLGSNSVIMGTEEIILSMPLLKKRDAVIVPPDFEDKVIKPLMRSIVRPLRRKTFKVVIDAGHGGKDPGAIGKTGTYEKNVVLDISKRLEKQLEKLGFETAMTREHDEFISLEKRTEITSRAQGDLFVSVHANAHPSRRINGIEVYTLRGLTQEEFQEEQRLKNLQIFFNKLSMKKDDPALQDVISDLLHRYKQFESPRLASFVSRGMSESLTAKNHGLKKSGFFVLRNTLVPAILVEVGFLSNNREERLLKSGAYRQKVAEGLAESIVNYTDPQ